MGKREAWRQELSRLLAADEAGALEACLRTNSGLPGPRGNLELAHALADELDRPAPGPAVGAALQAWRALAAAEAPTGDPREFLSFCGALAWSSDWARATGASARGGRSRATIAAGLRRASGDERWRMREAAAMALQRIGEAEPEALRALLEPWTRGSWLELRAVAAALAHPPLLADASFARWALGLADAVLRRVAAATPAARRQEDFRVLRQGLGYALSVLAAAAPREGFALLERWAGAARSDADLLWILRVNLKKKRLAVHSGRVSRLAAGLGGA